MKKLHIYKKLNDINDLKSEDSIKSVLNETSKDILEYTKCHGVSIYLYDKETKVITPYIASKEANNYVDLNNSINVSDKIVKYIISESNIIDNIKPKDELIDNYFFKEFLFNKDKDVKYVGCYKISVDSEFLGILNISYRKEPEKLNDYKEFMKFICKMIAIIIRSYKLNEELKNESEKRYIIESELEDYMDVSTDLVSVYDPINNIIKYNYSFNEILGWNYEELKKNGLDEYLHADDLDKLKELKEHIGLYNDIKNQKGSALLRYRCKNGEYKYIRWNVKYSYKSNLYISIGKDITQKIISEEQKKNLEENIKVEEYKNEFFANVSHEFKTPLNIILGTMQIMKRNLDSDNISKDNICRHIKNIKQNSYRLLRLVNNLIDISKIDSGHYKMCFSNNNIVSIIEDITMSVIPYVENKNINLIFDTDSEEIITYCDPESIERIILNLLSNAIKYTPSDVGEIKVSIKSNDEKIFISVKDNGRGISQEKIYVIFDRFEQGNDCLTKKKEGSGIGLALVKSMVQLHDGNITVKSDIGKGSEFIFELPIRLSSIECKNTKSYSYNENKEYYIEKCNVEFSDIYN